jgi:hypothetical protein
MPHYVKLEHVSQQHDALSAKIREIISSANAVGRSTAQRDLISFADEIRVEAEAVLSKSQTLLRDEFDDWLKSIGATSYPVSPEHGQCVTEDYFSGAPPFTAVKQRLDIPDSFIWQTILDVAKVNHPVVVISNDKAMYDAAEQSPRLGAYKSLDDFVQSVEVQEAVKSLPEGIMSMNLQRVVRLLKSKESYLAEIVDSLIIDALRRKEVHSGLIPEDNNEATITEVGIPEKLKFNLAAVEYYGVNEIGVS